MSILIGQVIAGYRVEYALGSDPDGISSFRAVPEHGGAPVLIRTAPWDGTSEESQLARAYTELQRLKASGTPLLAIYGVIPVLGIEYLITDLHPPLGANAPPASLAPSAPEQPLPKSDSRWRSPARPSDYPPPVASAMPAPARREMPEKKASRKAPPSPDRSSRARSSRVAPPTASRAEVEDFDLDDSMVAMPTEPPAVVADAESSPDQLRRRSACRWYKRMNPGHNFVLNVVFSESEIRLVATDALGVAKGTRILTLDKNDPVVAVEPVFPGCLVTPQRMCLDLTPEKVVAKFWVTPLVTSAMPDACVRVWYHDRLIEELPTPSKVVKRTIAHLCLGAGLLWPVFQQFCEWAGWSPGAELREGMPLLGRVIDFFGRTAGTAVVVGVFLVLAWFLYRVTRPVQAGQEEADLFDKR